MWLHKSARGMVSTRGFCDAKSLPCSPASFALCQSPHGLQSWGLAKPPCPGAVPTRLVWKKPAAYPQGLPSLWSRDTALNPIP